MKKGIIFDMDGTLFDTESIYQKGWEQMAYRYGQVYNPQFQIAACGTSGIKMINLVHEYYPGVDAERFIQECTDWVEEQVREYLPEKPGMREILVYAKRKGFKLAIASSSNMDIILSNLKSADIFHFFDVVASGHEVENGKPAPDVFLLAAERLGLDPSDCYVVEDGANGVRAGVAAGCDTFMVPDIIVPDEEMKSISHAICDSLYDVINIIEKENWKVTYDDGFWPGRGRAGKEIPIKKDFFWGEEHWHVPSVYACTKGLVVDYCIEVDNHKVQSFIDKWNLFDEESQDYTEREQELIRQEHPLNVDFRSAVEVNGISMEQECLYGEVWIASEHLHSQQEAANVLNYYGLNADKCWAIRRVAYPWAEKRPRTLKSIQIRLEQELKEVYGASFTVSKAGEEIKIQNPLDGQEHLLSIRAYEKQELDQKFFQHTGMAGMEYPPHFIAMSYTVYPEIEKFILRDTDKGDNPRRIEENPDGPIACGVGAVAILDKNVGQHLYVNPDGSEAKVATVCSSMHFEEVDEVRWETVFYRKDKEDFVVELL